MFPEKRTAKFKRVQFFDLSALSFVLCSPLPLSADLKQIWKCISQTVFEVDHIEIFFVCEHNRDIIFACLRKHLLKFSLYHTHLTKRRKRKHFRGNISFFFHRHHHNAFFLSSFTDRTGKRCSAVTIIFASHFHRFVDMSKCRIIKHFQHIC